MANVYKTNWAVNEKVPAADMNRQEGNTKALEGKLFGTLLSNYGFGVDVVSLVAASKVDNTGQTAGPASQAWGSVGSGGTPYLSITPVTGNLLFVVGTCRAKRNAGTGWLEARMTRVSGSGGTATHLLTANEQRLTDSDEKHLMFFTAIEGIGATEQRFQMQVRVQSGPTDQLTVDYIKMLGFVF